jgi:signal transduction histidine kinase
MNTRPRIRSTLSLISSLFGRSIDYMYRVFIQPRSYDEDSKRYEFILNTILCVLLPFLCFLDCIVAMYVKQQGVLYHGISFTKFTCIIVLFSYLLVLSRKGFYRTAAYIFLVLFYLLTSYGAARWGVELPLVAISYIVIIVISSILVSTRFSFLVTVIIALTVTVITSLQLNSTIEPILSWKHAPISIVDPIQLSFFFFLVTGISWLSNREIERSLRRARASEHALMEERDLLEMKIEERTKELKSIQKEKISQLYRFAEFGKLSSGIFHDLMNTLNIVVINVSRLEESPDHLSEVKQYVGKAVTASKRIGNYIQSVRKQIADNDSHSVFSIEKEIEDAMDIVHFKAREASVKIVHVIKSRNTFHGNSLKFYQVILNLLVNAIEACEDSTRSSVIEIVQKVASNKRDIFIIVKDNGCGISEEVLDSIFTPLFTTKSYTKGTGLGLSQTKEIVEKVFKGTITATSTENKGTIFTIYLPYLPYAGTISAIETDSEYM